MINKDLIIVVRGMSLGIQTSYYYLRWDVLELLCWLWAHLSWLVNTKLINIFIKH